MKNKKNLHGFSYSKSMANFEEFCGSFSLSTNLIFLMSAPATHILGFGGRSSTSITSALHYLIIEVQTRRLNRISLA